MLTNVKRHQTKRDHYGTDRWRRHVTHKEPHSIGAHRNYNYLTILRAALMLQIIITANTIILPVRRGLSYEGKNIGLHRGCLRRWR
jgi:hypothetical protein